MLDERMKRMLAGELDRHVAEEEEILRQYHAFSDKLEEGPLSVLVNHIVTEEEMHHFLLRTLSGWLRTPPEAGAPLVELGVDPDSVLRQTRALQEHEKKTIEACRDLGALLSDDEAAPFGTLLDAIALDSEKHQRLLSAVEKMLSGSARS